MSDNYINPSGLAAIRDWIKNQLSKKGNAELTVASLALNSTFQNGVAGEEVIIGNASNDTSILIRANGTQGARMSQNILPTKKYVQDNFQEKLVSGTNVKTINGESILGSGNIYAGADFSINTASNSGIVGQGNDYLGVDLNAADNLVVSLTKPGEYAVSKSVPTSDNVSAQVSNLQAQIDALGEPFRVKQWGANLNIQIPTCTTDIDNTSIPKTTFTISGQEGIDFQILGMLAYEVFGADGKRINCWPVCQFTGNGQKELGVRWMCGGTVAKEATRISAWVLLKHR